MNHTREEQAAALKEISNYVGKLIQNIPSLSEELRGKEKPDTKEFLDQMIQGLGWVIEVTNTIMPLLNEKKEYISKSVMNAAIISLNSGLESKENEKIADALDGKIKDFLKGLLTASREIE